MSTAATFHYADVISDLKTRAAALLDIATRLEGFVLLEERRTVVLPSGGKPAPVVAAKPRTSPRRSGEAMSMREAIAQALAEGPLTSAELAARVLALRPGTPKRAVSKVCWAERQAKRIAKGADDRWRVGHIDTQAAPVPPKPENRVDSIAETIRRAAEEPGARTKTLLVQRVADLCPGTTKANIQTQLNQQIAQGKLHYDPEDNWGVRRIVDGAIVFPRFDLNGVEVGAHAPNVTRNGKQVGA